MRSIIVTSCLALLVLGTGVAGPTRAQDIDLFMGPPPTATTDKPNILFVIDNAAANNASVTNTCSATQKKIDMEKCVLATFLNTVFPAVDADTPAPFQISDFNIGVAIYTPSGSTKGGYIRKAVKDLAVGTNKADLISSVNAIPEANNAPFALTMHEAYLYYSGQAPYAGISGSAPYDPAAYSTSTGKYVSPAAGKCQKNYVIFIGNGGPDSSENTTAEAKLTALGGRYTTDPLTTTYDDPSTTTVVENTVYTNYNSNWLDEYARFLDGKDISTTLDGIQNITTYTIAVYNPGDNNQNTKPAMGGRALLSSAGNLSGGYFEATSSQVLEEIFKNIFTKVAAVNSVFASVTLPVSVNVRGTYLNQVYMGVFRPDADAKPRWAGNLKEYQLTIDSRDRLQLSDANGAVVTNSATGFINPDVTSYWTHDTTPPYWSFSPSGVGGASDMPDGDVVEKGAAAQWLRSEFAASQAARKLYTCTGTCADGSLLSATPFDTTNAAITTAATGVADATGLANLINWVRGRDLKDEDKDGNTAEVRPSIHGDVLHSRPALVNYNRYGDTNDVFVFYGGNDGLFHAIQGGQLTAAGTRQGGTEQWGFIPSEFFGRLKYLYDNSINIKTDAVGKPYFADGPIGVHQLDANNNGKLLPADNDQVHLFLAMRRGGRLLYALDATDPAAPKFMWKRSNTSAGYAELAQTWSSPTPVKVRAFADPVLIMGAGYDAAAEDAHPQGAATMGRGVLVVDATNGNVLWQLGKSPAGATTNKTEDGMNFSIAAEMTILDRDQDGYMDRVYAADTGANVWRIDIDDPDPANWTWNKLAALGGTGSNARKFLYAPDVIYGDSASGSQPYDAVLIGSGDREHPFDETIVNRFYMLRDTNMTKSKDVAFTTITEASLYDATANDIQDGSTSGIRTDAETALKNARGWYVTLFQGEKVVGAPVTLNGTVFFGTNQPSSTSPSACTNLGTARLYGMSFLDATATIEQCNNGTNADGSAKLGVCDRYTTLEGGGFPPSPTPAVTIINGEPREAVISGTNVQEPPESILGARRRVYWHHNVDN